MLAHENVYKTESGVDSKANNKIHSVLAFYFVFLLCLKNK